MGLPRGTVTFLFTDIEGSTRLLKRLGDRYAAVLAAHQEILRAAVKERGGREVDNQGEAFFFAFASANAAVGAAVGAQRALAAHEWANGDEVRVRMGLHTGEPLHPDGSRLAALPSGLASPTTSAPTSVPSRGVFGGGADRDQLLPHLRRRHAGWICRQARPCVQKKIPTVTWLRRFAEAR
jgi:hypothetical protein